MTGVYYLHYSDAKASSNSFLNSLDLEIIIEIWNNMRDYQISTYVK